MGVFKPGEFLRVQRIRHRPPMPEPVDVMDVRAKPDLVYVLMYLGTEPLDESSHLDFGQVLRGLGISPWAPTPEKEPVQFSLTELATIRQALYASLCPIDVTDEAFMLTHRISNDKLVYPIHPTSRIGESVSDIIKKMTGMWKSGQKSDGALHLEEEQLTALDLALICRSLYKVMTSETSDSPFDNTEEIQAVRKKILKILRS